MLKAFLLGLIEGITEFLPISSTAHLILFSKILNIPQTEFHKFFEVFIQSGAILAVLLSYFKILTSNKKIIKNLIISFIPTALVSLIFYKIVKNLLFESELIIILMLILGGIIFLGVEILIKKEKLVIYKTINQMSWFQAILIGLIQAISIIPGVSRSGAVILGMLFLGFKREDSVIYSFLLAIPTIVSAGIYDLYKTSLQTPTFSPENFISLLVGIISSFIFASITIKWFLKYLQKNDLSLFGYYRIIFGLIFFILLFSS